MSAPTISVNTEVDPSLSQDSAHIEVNGTMVTYRQFPATSYSNTGVSFSVVPPSMGVYMNRAIQITTPVTIVITGTSSDGMAKVGYHALRSLADMRIITSQTIQINGTAVPIANVYDIHPDILLHYNAEYRRLHPLGAPDMTQDIDDNLGTIFSPLSAYQSSESFPGGQKRGAYYLTSYSENSTTSATMVLNLVSWLYVPELLGLDCDEEVGLCFCRDFNVNLQLDLSSKNVMSAATYSGLSITSIVTTITGQPSLLCKFITPPPELVPQSELRYRFKRMESFRTQYGTTLAPNASATIVSNNIQLPCVPRFVYMFVREQDSSKTHHHSDTFAALTNISVNFNNQASLLNSASDFDLWKMSNDCGLIDSMSQFRGLTRSSAGFGTIVGSVGSLFCAAFGKHISTNGLAIGQAGQFNFSAQVTAKNVNQSDTFTNPVLYIVVCYDHEMIIDVGGGVRFEQPIVPVGAIASGVGGEVLKVPYSVHGLGVGKAHGAGALDFFKKAFNFLKGSKLISTVANLIPPSVPYVGPAAKVVGPIASMLGLGVDGGRRVGGRPVGGAVLNKSELAQLVRDL